MKKILIIMITVVLLYGCSANQTEVPSPSPTSSPSNPIEDYDASLVEGTLVSSNDTTIVIKNTNDIQQKPYSVSQKVLKDIESLEIAVGDKIILKIQNGVAMEIEKVISD